MVISGIPGGGIMGEVLIMTMFGLPPEALPLMNAIGQLVDPPSCSLLLFPLSLSNSY